MPNINVCTDHVIQRNYINNELLLHIASFKKYLRYIIFPNSLIHTKKLSNIRTNLYFNRDLQFKLLLF